MILEYFVAGRERARGEIPRDRQREDSEVAVAPSKPRRQGSQMTRQNASRPSPGLRGPEILDRTLVWLELPAVHPFQASG